MRVAFVTQWFPPERGTAVAAAIAGGLAALGHEVDVLTAFPNYPTGKIYPGWRQRPYAREDYLDGVTVHRSPVFASHDARPVRRMGTYLSHAASATAVGATRIARPDVWLVYSSPATAALPAQLARPGRRAPVCLLIQDLWPDSVTGSGMVAGPAGRAVHRVLEAYAGMSYRHATRIGVISPGMADVLTARGVPADKVSWTPNWLPDGTDGSPEPDAPRVRNRRRTFLYAGNLGRMQGLHELVDAFAAVPDAHLVLLGDGVEAEDLRRRATVLPNITVLPAVDESEVPGHLARADVLVVSLQDTPLLRVTMPSKVQTSLRAGRPLLVHAAGDAARLVTDHGAGVFAPPGDTDRTAAAIRSLQTADDAELAAMGTAARRCYDTTFSEAVGVRRLETMLVTAQEEAHR